MSDGYYVTLEQQDGTTETIPPEDLISLRAPVEHSVINEWELTVPYDEFWDDFRYGSALIEYENKIGEREAERRGPVDLISHNDSNGETKIRGRGEVARLESNGPTLPFIAAGPAWKEIQRMWNEIPGWTADITEPVPETERTDRVIQQLSTATEWSDVYTEPAQLPYTLDGDQLTIDQTAFTTDTVDQDLSNCFTRDGTDFNADDASDGQYAGLVSDAQEVKFDFEPFYDIPADAFAVYIRWGLESGAEDNHGEPYNGGIAVYINGPSFDEETLVGEYPVVQDGFENLFEWVTPFDGTRPDEFPDVIEQGLYTVRITPLVGYLGTSTTDPGTRIDVVAPLDDRWTYEFDNTLNTTGGYLDGPGLHGTDIAPGPVPASALSDLNITSGTLEVTPVNASSVENLQLRAGSDDEPWRPTDPTAGTTQSVDFEISTGRVQGRVSLNAREGLSTRDQTPRLKYEPQAISDWEIRVDENDLQFFSGSTYEGTWFDIAQEIHDDGNLVFRNIPDQSKTVEVFQKGDKSETVDWTRLSFKKEFDVTDFANKVIAVGEPKERLGVEIRSTNSPVAPGETAEVNTVVQFNDPPKVVVKDQDSIDAVGEFTAFIRVSASSEGAVRNKALAELDDRISLDERTGSVSIVPQRLKPGYTYTVPAFGGIDAELAKQTFQDVGSAKSRLNFRIVSDVSTVISGVRKEARQ